MSERQDKRIRREMRREVRGILRTAGALPEQALQRKPWWMPTGLWARLYHWLLHGRFVRSLAV